MIILLVILLISGSSIAVAGRKLRHRRLRHVYRCIDHIGCYISSPSTDTLSEMRSGLSILAFAESVAFVCEHLSGEAEERMREIVRYHSLDCHMLLLAEHSQGSRRAYPLALLACLPLDTVLIRRIEPMLDDKDEDVRFYALLCYFAIDEHIAQHQLGRFGRRLSHYEMAELLPKVCRQTHSVAWTPLLRSSDYNLCLLGINIVRRFSIVESEPDLMHVIEEGDDEVAYHALCTLAELQCDVATPSVRRWMHSQRKEVRHILCHHFVRSGYSLRSVTPALGKGERAIFEQMLHTYKRQIG